MSRNLYILRQQGSLIEGIPLDKGGSLRVVLCKRETLKELPAELERDSGDNAILASALELKRQCQCAVILVSKDTNIRIKANALGLAAEDYETDKVDVDDLYSGTTEVLLEPELINKLYKDGSITIKEEFFPNQALTLVDSTNPSHTALATFDGVAKKIVALSKVTSMEVSRILARNREQKFALDLLLRESISLVTLVGQAGTGKTLLAIAAGLSQVADTHIYSRLLISRPVIPMGRDLGFLPGDVNEKLTPWM